MFEEVSAPRPPAAYVIRDARHDDLPAVCEIYNHYVLHSTVTFDEESRTASQWEARLDELQRLGMPVLVLEGASGQVLGYGLVAPWRQKAAYRYTVENSIYLHPDAAGKGYGAALLAELIERSRAAGLREIIAVIADEGADASIALHHRLGFAEIGRMQRVGYKFGRWLGIVLLQKSLA
ncbi:GNAT family N-acetyltransferase [Tessaracoccus oleiagri]|uniref:Phosphinothricin acetyltransferase n=1 Tax=Tessaracoccus oleiagri TaxID=686624 RepID=A0A1G9L5J4_9ACTN|nr:GNAT family N-acetyltransferase [Tessaracoccus oleiagri]SDL57259.1 phosphinothricin acetyltransferase [Tessaracoccus oleiagri]